LTDGISRSRRWRHSAVGGLDTAGDPIESAKLSGPDRDDNDGVPDRLIGSTLSFLGTYPPGPTAGDTMLKQYGRPLARFGLPAGRAGNRRSCRVQPSRSHGAWQALPRVARRHAVVVLRRGDDALVVPSEAPSDWRARRKSQRKRMGFEPTSPTCDRHGTTAF
jgi:hypothetical protein